MTEIKKPVYNEEFRLLEFLRPDGAGQLNADEAVTAAEAICTEFRTGTDVTAAMISDVAPYNQTACRYKLKGGLAGQTYLLAIHITTSNGQKLAETLTVRVIQ